MNLLKQTTLVFGIFFTACLAHGEEATATVTTALSSTTISGYLDVSAQWNPGPTYSIPTGRPAGRWSFDTANGNVVKDSISGLDGRLSETGATLVSDSVSGLALSLEMANNGFVDFGNIFDFRGDFSISVWLKARNGIADDSSHIVSRHVAGYPNGYALSITQSGSEKAIVTVGGVEAGARSKKKVTDGKWHQLVAVYRRGVGKFIYVDGVLEGSNSGEEIVPNEASFMVGGMSVDGVLRGQFTGLVDELEVYDRALSGLEVLSNYQGKSLPLLEIIWQHTDGRIATWQMKGTSLLATRSYFRAPWKLIGGADFNRDGYTDFLIGPAPSPNPGGSQPLNFINTFLRSERSLRYFVVSGAAPVMLGRVDTYQSGIASGWEIVSLADCDGDGRKDLITSQANRYAVAFLKDHAPAISRKSIGYFPPASQFVGAGDFNKDRQAEFLFQNGNRLRLYPVQYAGLPSSAFLELPYSVAGGWKAVTVADFNGDKSPDVVWQNARGQVAVWLMNGTQRVSSILLRDGQPASSGWRIVGVN